MLAVELGEGPRAIYSNISASWHSFSYHWNILTAMSLCKYHILPTAEASYVKLWYKFIGISSSGEVRAQRKHLMQILIIRVKVAHQTITNPYKIKVNITLYNVTFLNKLELAVCFQNLELLPVYLIELRLRSWFTFRIYGLLFWLIASCVWNSIS